MSQAGGEGLNWSLTGSSEEKWTFLESSMLEYVKFLKKLEVNSQD